MRVMRWLITSLVLVLALSLAGSAVAAPRSATLADPIDVISTDGYARPDVAQFTVTHDPDTGVLATTVRFHAPVPRQQAGRSTAFRITYNTGSAAPQGYCDWTHAGDLGVRIDVVRAPEGDYIVQTATPKPSGPDIVDNAAGFFSADGTTLTLTTAPTAVIRGEYTCVSPTRVIYEGLSGADEIEGFFFAGFEPGAPPPDNQPPSVRWETPGAGATISGVYSEGGLNGSRVCRLSASDNVRVNRIEIFVDNVPTEIQRFAPWGCELDTRTLLDGPHLLRADAYDEAGNKTSTAITVTVLNAGVAPPPPPPPVVAPPNTPVIPTPAPPVNVAPITQPITTGTVVPPRPEKQAALKPNVISRLESFVRCRVRSGKVRSCRVKPGAFLSVRVTDARGRPRKDNSGKVRVKITCRPRKACVPRSVVRLRVAKPKLTSLIGRRLLGVGTVIDFRITRAGATGSFHRLTITRNGPRTRTCELRNGRPRACE